MNDAGTVLAAVRVPEGLEGLERLHALLGDHAEEPDEIVVGIKTDRGMWVGALVAAGYEVFAVNPLAVNRYRDRHATSGAKSDPGDAKVLCRPRAHRPPQPPAHRRRHRARRRNQAASAGAPELHLGPPAPGQPSAQRAARVLSPGE